MGKKRRLVVILGAAALIVALVAWVALVAAMPPSHVPETPEALQPSSPTHMSSSPPSATTTQGQSPRPPALSDADFYSYVKTLPGVTGVTPDTIGELSELLCRALKSPKMSASYFAELVQLEVSGYHLTEEQALQLLLNATYNGCPDATRVVTSHGSLSAG